MAKNQFIRARVAGWEKDCIRRKADAAHMTESEFVRRAAMDREVTVIEGMDALRESANSIRWKMYIPAIILVLWELVRHLWLRG